MWCLGNFPQKRLNFHNQNMFSLLWVPTHLPHKVFLWKCYNVCDINSNSNLKHVLTEMLLYNVMEFELKTILSTKLILLVVRINIFSHFYQHSVLLPVLIIITFFSQFWWFPDGKQRKKQIQNVRVKMDKTWLILTPYNDTIHQKGTESYSNKTRPEKG